MALRITPRFALTVWDLDDDRPTREQITGNFDRIEQQALVAADLANALGEYSQSSRDFVSGLTVAGADVMDVASTQTVTGVKAFPDGTTIGGQAPATKVGSTDLEITDPTKGIILTAPNASRWRVTVSNAGALVVTAL